MSTNSPVGSISHCGERGLWKPLASFRPSRATSRKYLLSKARSDSSRWEDFTVLDPSWATLPDITDSRAWGNWRPGRWLAIDAAALPVLSELWTLVSNIRQDKTLSLPMSGPHRTGEDGDEVGQGVD